LSTAQAAGRITNLSSGCSLAVALGFQTSFRGRQFSAANNNPTERQPRNTIMKTYAFVAAASLAFAFAGQAMAQTGEATYDYPVPAVSAKSRAEVLAELQQARQQGQLQVGEAGWPQLGFSAQKSRSDVRADTLAAVKSGELRRLNEEPQSAYDTPLARAAGPLMTAAK
jgi:hypothetical protein